VLALRDVLLRQELVVSRQQALAAGLTPEAWEWRLERGVWQRACPGVAAAHSGALSPVQRSWAAVLHVGPGAALTGDALLHALGFPFEPPGTVDVLVPHARKAVGVRLGDGTLVRVRRTRAGSGLRDPGAVLPAVSRHVAVLQAAAWAPTEKACEWRLAAAVQRRLTAVPLLLSSLALLPRLPRARLIRTVLDDVELGAHAGSELAFLRFLRRHGLPLPDELQLKVRAGGTTAYLDGRYRELRLSVEVDGAHHRDVATWEADALRTLRVAATLPGERVVRITMGNLRHDGPEVARLLRALLLPTG
jgi:hypothetical protein